MDNIATFDEVPPVQEEKPKGIRETDDVFYAATTSGTGDPVKDYQNGMLELQSTGKSSLVDMAKQRWEREQDDVARATLVTLMQDNTVDIEYKRSALQIYSLGGYVSPHLKDKYLEHVAVIDPAPTAKDRLVQDAYGKDAHARNDAKVKEEAVAHEARGQSLILNTAKGTASVGTSILASIPAGYAGLISLIYDKDSAKATKVIEDVTRELTYSPTEEGAQKVVKVISDAAEFLDIPFKWIGDKAFEVTGSPAVGTVAYVGSSTVGYVGAIQGAKRLAVGKPKVDADTPAAATAHANKDQASNLGAAAVADSTGQVANAMGTTREGILSQWLLPNITDEYGVLHPSIRKNLDDIDKQLNEVYTLTQVDPYLVPKSQIDADAAKMTQIFKESAGPTYQMQNSMVNVESTGISGKMVFGRNGNHGYETELAAQNALNDLSIKLKEMEGFEGKPTVVEMDGQFVIELPFKRPYDPYTKLSMGDDVLSASFLGFDVTNWANNSVGKYIFPSYMRMKGEIPSAGALATHKTARIEGAYLDLLRNTANKSKHKKDLSSLMRQGEDEGKVFTTADFAIKYPHLTPAERIELQSDYVAMRRIADHLYKSSEREFTKKLNREDMQVIYDEKGEKLGFASSKIKADETPKRVWDMEKKQVVDHTTDKFVVRLYEQKRVGEENIRYAYLAPSMKLVDPHPGLLTRIPGYIPRENKIYWAVDRVPKSLIDNGKKVAGSELRNYKSTIGGDITQKKAQALADRLNLEDPTHLYEIRKDRRRIEDAIIGDSAIYENYFKQGHKRGGRLDSLYGKTELEDVAVAFTNAIKSTSRLVAWSDINASLQKNWVRSYGEFTKGTFPESIQDIHPHKDMTPLLEKRFKAATEVYNQIRFQTIADDALSDRAWKYATNALADGMEPFAKDGKLIAAFRELALKGNIPLKAVATLPRHMWLYLRPARQWVVQPSQGLELSLIDPKFLPNEGMKILPVFMGLLQKKSPMLKNMQPLTDFMGKPIKDYQKIVDAFYDAGILQSVDTNILIHGLFKDPASPLVQGNLGKAVDVSKSALQLPSKIGRKVGYDSAELMNQVTNWLFSKRQWELKNPGKDWSKPENVADISAYAWRLGHGASGRAGMMPWQEGLVGTFLQFAAIPHKGMMQTFSAKEFTGAQKAKLAASRAFWYGVYGVPLGYAMTEFFKQYLPEEMQGNVEEYKAGIADKLINKAITAMSSDETDTDLAIAKSVTVIPETPFFWELSKELFDLATGATTGEGTKFPYQTGWSALFDTTKTFWDVLHVNEYEWDTLEDSQKQLMMEKGLSLAGGMKDYFIAKQIETYKDRLTKSGDRYGLHMSLAEAEARLWTGIRSKKEDIIMSVEKNDMEYRKYVKEGAKDLRKRMENIRGILGTPEWAEKAKQINAYLNGYDEQFRSAILKEFFEIDRVNVMSKKESLMFSYLRDHAGRYDKYATKARTELRQLNDPQVDKFLETMDKEGI